MTTENKIQKLNREGWNVVFNKTSFKHEANRGIYKYQSSNITELYKIIKNDFN